MFAVVPSRDEDLLCILYGDYHIFASFGGCMLGQTQTVRRDGLLVTSTGSVWYLEGVAVRGCCFVGSLDL